MQLKELEECNETALRKTFIAVNSRIGKTQ